MYYPISQQRSRKGQYISTFLIIFLSVVTFHSQAFANTKDDIAEEYRIQGYEYQLKGNLDVALALYAKAVSLSTQPADALNDMGVVYEQLGIFEKAEESYLAAVKSNADHLPAYLNLAYLYQQHGQLDKAIEYFRLRAALGDPAEYWTKKAKDELYQLAPDLKQEMIERAADELATELIAAAHQKFVQRVSQADLHYRRGKRFEEDGELTKAVGEYHEALLLTPDNPVIMEAIEHAQAALTNKKVKQHAHIAIEMLDSGDRDSAKKEFQKILTILPDKSISQ